MPRYERKDSWHRRAKREGFRSRAAYKLEEIQRSQRVLRRGQRVVDLGCWPGGWLQVAARVVGPEGRVIGVDVTPLEADLEEPQVSFLEADLTDAGTPERLLETLGGPADVVLSDAAPKLTGVRATDRAREEALLEAIEALLGRILRPGGDLVVKILEGPEAQAVAQRLRRRFERAKAVKPRASRKGTTERYLVGRGFRGYRGNP
ncbi:MAG: RlmE family RNA methyltransferase [Myxococcota bacterium]|nr:RlmE family RNA methyltransferase [Myxococcota bacterium]